MTFIETMRSICCGGYHLTSKAAHYHDDEVHIRQILEASGLVPKGEMDLAAASRPRTDLNGFPSG